MPNIQDVESWRGRRLENNDGDKIGTIEEIYLDRQTDEPEWLAVKTGLLGSKISFVPIGQAASSGDAVRVPFAKNQVNDAPSAEADGELSEEEERALYAHYGRDFGDFDYDASADRRTVGRDTSGPETDGAMTRSEEELAVGKRQVETGRARLRKHVVTERVQTTVPVQREEVRIEREPITDANVGAATDGPALSEEEHEVVLRAEQPVVEKTVVPKERVRLDKDIVTEERQVSEEVRKEQIEVDGERVR